MMNKFEKLNNPVWHALNETHEHFGIDYGGVKFYKNNICPFGGFTDITQTKKALNNYSTLTASFFVVGNTPNYDNTVTLNKTVVCEQMILDRYIENEYHYKIIQLSKQHVNELYDLIWLVMPGYYQKKTFDMGDYYGIFVENKLVAVTGERMQLDDFIEVSTVVTHPDYVRKGMAKQLVAYTTEQIISKNKVPILHVAEHNLGAIELYKKLGYTSLRKMTWRHFLRH